MRCRRILALMYEKSDNSWYALSDQALVAHIGGFVKHHRIRQNKSQALLSKDAGISRSSISLLEHGEMVSLPTLLQVLRALGQLQILAEFNVQREISPLALAKAEQAQRKRASRIIPADEEKSDW